MKSSGCASLYPLGPDLNGGVNGSANESLRGEKRLIGFVDHLSMKEEPSNNGTLQAEKNGQGSPGTNLSVTSVTTYPINRTASNV